jgi:hypothetical protein
LVFALYGSARIYDVGKHTAGAQKHIVATGYTRVEAHIVLHLYTTAQHHAARHKHILPQATVGPQHRPGHNVAKVPNLAALAYLGTGIYNGCGVGKIGHGAKGNKDKEPKTSACKITRPLGIYLGSGFWTLPLEPLHQTQN